MPQERVQRFSPKSNPGIGAFPSGSPGNEVDKSEDFCAIYLTDWIRNSFLARNEVTFSQVRLGVVPYFGAGKDSGQNTSARARPGGHKTRTSDGPRMSRTHFSRSFFPCLAVFDSAKARKLTELSILGKEGLSPYPLRSIIRKWSLNISFHCGGTLLFVATSNLT